MTMNLDITPALLDPGCDPSQVILYLDLPAIGQQDCRAVPLEVALQVVQDLTLKLTVDQDASRTVQDIHEVRASGLTAVVHLYAVEATGTIKVYGMPITPAVQA